MTIEYQRWANHPLRALLREAAHRPIQTDEIDDLRLPDRLRTAVEEAVERLAPKDGKPQAPKMGANSPDNLAKRLVAALPEGHETRWEYEDRRAMAGDAQALAAVRARKEGPEAIAERIANKDRL